jgi:hypothetical protein
MKRTREIVVGRDDTMKKEMKEFFILMSNQIKAVMQ